MRNLVFLLLLFSFFAYSARGEKNNLEGPSRPHAISQTSSDSVEKSPIWIQVGEEQDSSDPEESKPSYFGFVFQKDKVKVHSQLPFGQMLMMGGVRVEKPFFLKGFYYQVTGWVGESEPRQEWSPSWQTQLLIQSRMFGLELGLIKSWPWLAKVHLVTDLTLRSQFITQFAPQSQFPNQEQGSTFLGVGVGVQYFFSPLWRGGVQLAYDPFFDDQVRLGVDRQW